MSHRRVLLRPILGAKDVVACLDELDRNPNWPPDLALLLAIEVAEPDAYATILATNATLSERIETTLLRRFGSETFDNLVQAVKLFDLPNHTFTNQWPTHYYITEKSTVEQRVQAVCKFATAFVSALQSDPSLFRRFREVTEVAFVQYKLPCARGMFEILLDALPGFREPARRAYIPDCHFYLGMLLRTTEPEAAKNHFQCFLKLQPKRRTDNNWPINPGYIPNMLHRPSSVRAWAEIGRISKQQGDLVRARTCFQRAIELDPQSQEAPYRDVAEMHEQARDIRKAMRLYRQSLEVRTAALIDKRQRWSILERPYRRELAELCLHMVPHVDPSEAQRLLRQALTLNPDDAYDWMHELQSLFDDIAGLQRQTEVCTRAVRLGADISNNDTAESGFHLEMNTRFQALFIEIAESFLGERRGYTKALAWLRKVKRICGDRPELLLRQIQIVAQFQRDHWQVIDLCDVLLSIVPGHPDALRFKEQAQKGAAY